MNDQSIPATSVPRAVQLLRDDGYAILPGFIPETELADAIGELPLMYPTAEEFEAEADSTRMHRFRESQFGGVDCLPFASMAWNLLAVNPRILSLAREILHTSEVRLYQAEAWAKYGGAIDYDQHLHRDFRNHSLVVPSNDERYAHVEMFVYLTGVDENRGPTHVVSHRYSADVPFLPLFRSREDAPELYEVERPVVGPPGTLFVYWPSTFHRGSSMHDRRGTRYTLHLNFRTAASEWVNRRGWGQYSGQDMWVDFVEKLRPEQLAVFGFPAPGHPYWTAETLAGVQLRYPKLDLEPWRTRA